MHNLLQGLKAHTLRFARDEDGSIVILSLFLIVVMLIVAGMSVDIARHEEQRALVQSTLDRSVLASASLDQTGDAAAAQAIVRDYFTKSGVQASLGPITADVAINSRRVSATASTILSTFFMRMTGINALTVPASSTAMEATQDIEIVLVLDVSYSMIYNIQTGQYSDRLENLKIAAREFISTVLANDREQRVSIAIVPFNGQVNLGQNFLNAFDATFNVTDRHSTANSFCLDIPSNAFDAIAIPTGEPLPQAGHFDSWGDNRARSINWAAPLAFGSTTNSPFDTNMTAALTPVCRTAAGNFVTLPPATSALSANQTDPRIATLQAAIGNPADQITSGVLRNNFSTGLQAGGFTSIYLGMKWGLMLLDPSMRPVYTALGQTGSRPYDHNRAHTQKIIVLMTDGEHQASHYLNTGYRTGASNIWRWVSGSTTQYSVFFSDRVNNATPTTRCNSTPYWVPHLGQWHNRPWNGSSTNATSGCNYVSGAAPANGTNPVPTQLDWPQVWANLQVNWVASQLYARGWCASALGGRTNNQTCIDNEYMRALIAIRGPVNGSDTLDSSGELTEFAAPLDTMLQRACAQARDPVPSRTDDQPIIVYGIAFEAPAVGQQQISRCASSGSTYFYIRPDGQGLDINAVFHTIAVQINALKLVQ